MSSVIERKVKQYPTPEMRFTEEVSELPDGVWFPFSNMLTDYVRTGYPPFAQELFPLGYGMLSSLPDTRICVRGSTLMYKLLNLSGAEKRGTMAMGIQLDMLNDIKQNPHTASATALKRLLHFSDLDLFLPDVSIEDFDSTNNTIVNHMRERLGIPVVGGTATRHAVQIIDIKTGEPKMRLAKIEVDRDTVSGIPYCEAVAKVGDKNLLIMFWTPGDITKLKVQDTRRDPHFALSWDYAAIGEVHKIPPDSVSARIQKAGAAKKKVQHPQYARLVHEEGICASEGFAKGKDIWFHIPRENVETLCKPMETGSEFEKLPVVEQFILALRAAQKGSMAEENIKLTKEGRQALAGRKAPALTEHAITVLRNIDLASFESVYQTLSGEARQSLQTEVMNYMVTGFFYPSKFIEYCREINLFRFFPQLVKRTDEEWDAIAKIIPKNEIYSFKQHTATHSWETGIRFPKFMPAVFSHENVEQWIRERAFQNAFINPYMAFLHAEASVMGRKYNGSWLEVMDVFLSIEDRSGYPQERYEINYNYNDVEQGQNQPLTLNKEALERAAKRREIEVLVADILRNGGVVAGILGIIAGIAAGLITHREMDVYTGMFVSGGGWHVAMGAGLYSHIRLRELEKIRQELAKINKDEN